MSGIGNFSYWIEKLHQHYFRKVGIKPLPGTLNVQFDEPYALPKRVTWGIGVNGARALAWDLSWAHWATNWTRSNKPIPQHVRRRAPDPLAHPYFSVCVRAMYSLSFLDVTRRSAFGTP